jgi:hypothetical protein
MTNPGRLQGKYPARVTSYDGVSRTCEVSIEGVTDGSERGLRAEIEYPVGDSARDGHPTEIEINPGALVWVEFIQGDPRAPLITGYRNPGRSNDVDWRRWHHKNVELLADELMVLNTEQGLRVRAGTDLQMQADGGAIRIKADGGAIQIRAVGPIQIVSTGGSIVLQSATGTQVV